MIQRCHNQKSQKYRFYGARGIAVCERWRTYKNFRADMGERPEGMLLERIKSDEGYCPENCKWASLMEQKRNTRKCLRWHINGQTFESSRDAASSFGVTHGTVRRWAQTGKHGCYTTRRYA
jgi:hypothetical protein